MLIKLFGENIHLYSLKIGKHFLGSKQKIVTIKEKKKIN